MTMQPNRLQANWRYIEKKLREHYPRVPVDLWDRTEGEHDKIVRQICRTYAVGRSELTVEAEVRDRLNIWVAQIEAIE
jgi:hypothetical protein